jgi:hypothetical protein
MNKKYEGYITIRTYYLEKFIKEEMGMSAIALELSVSERSLKSWLSIGAIPKCHFGKLERIMGKEKFEEVKL